MTFPVFTANKPTVKGPQRWCTAASVRSACLRWAKRHEKAVHLSKLDSPLLDFHNELSVISQCPTTFICPDSSQPPPFINPPSPRRHAPPTPRVVYHVRWNRVSPAVNLGNGVTRETPGTLALISRRNVTENDERFQEPVRLASLRRRRCRCAH